MKALSVRQPWASLIAAGIKTLEIRSKRTRHRGPLLICASQRPAYDTLPCGVAVCIVDVVDARPMRPEDEAASGVAYDPALWAWELAGACEVEPVEVTGRLGFYDVPEPRALATA